MSCRPISRFALGPLCLMFFVHLAVGADPPSLVGHWLLQNSAEDVSVHRHRTQNHGATLAAKGANFDGRDDWLEVQATGLERLWAGDFTIAMWVQSGLEGDDRPGDLFSCYDTANRRGVQLGLQTSEVTTTRANVRNVHFGIDNDVIEKHWYDHGQLGKANFIFGLAVHRGQLFAATCEPDAGQSGHVYRWSGESHWIDCGIPVRANSVTALAEFEGQLYAASGKYRLAGSALKESPNAELGGRIYRYESDGKWIDCGQLPGAEAVGGLAVFRGRLYAASLYRPAGFFRFDGKQTWTSLPTPNGKRVEAMCVFNGQLFASSYDEAHVYRFDGEQWADCGQVGDATNTQTYSFAVHNGQLYVGTWRSGKVFRYDGDNLWVDCGQLGSELEVMGMIVHNGRFLAGSLPSAGVFQYEGKSNWKLLENIDKTPDVMYRRAWTMAEYQGRVFVGTLPAGRVFSNQAGVQATFDESFPTGWHHVTAQRSAHRLKLFLDGKPIATSRNFDGAQFDLTCHAPIKIGFGSNDYFLGGIRDVRIYRGALTVEAIRELAEWSTQ